MELAVKGVERGFDKELHPVMRVFFYMPFMLTEALEIQERSLGLFKAMEKDFNAPLGLACFRATGYMRKGIMRLPRGSEGTRTGIKYQAGNRHQRISSF